MRIVAFEVEDEKIRTLFITDEKRGIECQMFVPAGRKQCNHCKYYCGVHNAQGHAPCLMWHAGGVLWNEYCSRFEEVKE